MMTDYLLIGHITADLIDSTRILGGTVSYAVPVVRAFGHQAKIFTSAAPDEPLLKTLQPLADISVRVAAQTTTFENRYSPAGRTQIVHHIADPLTPDWLPGAWQGASLVHLAPLVNEIPPEFAAYFPDATVLLTPQGFLRQWDDNGRVTFANLLSDEMLAHVDIIVFSKEDIADAPDPQLFEQQVAQAVTHCIVTDGERGGTYYHEGVATPYASVPAHEVHPTGAGDVFAAALLASLPLFDDDVHMALSVARHLAAESVQHQGTQGVTAAAVQAALDGSTP